MGVNLFRRFGTSSARINEEMRTSQVEEFNNKFLAYDQRVDITADEIVSIINFAKHSNDSYDLFLGKYTENVLSPYFVDVFVGGTNSSFSYMNYINYSELRKAIDRFLDQYNTTLFKCNVNESHVMIKTENHVNPIDGSTETITRKIISKTPRKNDNYNSGDIIIDNKSDGTGKVTKIIFYEADTKEDGNLITTKNKDEYEFYYSGE